MTWWVCFGCYVFLTGRSPVDVTEKDRKAATHYFDASFIKIIIEPWHEISNDVVCATSKGSDQPEHTHRLIRAFASRLNILWLFSY